MRLRDAAIPISILLGFAVLGAAIHTKENDFQTCVRMTAENVLADRYTNSTQSQLQALAVQACIGK